MARAGRKRKYGRRQPNGQLSRERAVQREDILATVRSQPHRRRFGKNFTDQKAECELGRLCMDGIIVDTQYRAGEGYRALVIAMRRAIMAPSPDPTSMDMNGGARATAANMDDRGDNAARSRYADAFCALADAGRDAVLAVNDIAIYDKPRKEMRGTFADLRAGLNALDRFFSIVGKTHRVA